MTKLEALRAAVESRNWLLVELALESAEKSLSDALGPVAGTSSESGEKVPPQCTHWNDKYGACILSKDHDLVDNGAGVLYKHKYVMVGPEGNLDVREAVYPKDWTPYDECVYCHSEKGSPCRYVGGPIVGSDMATPHLSRKLISQNMDGESEKEGEVTQSPPPVPTRPHTQPPTCPNCHDPKDCTRGDGCACCKSKNKINKPQGNSPKIACAVDHGGKPCPGYPEPAPMCKLPEPPPKKKRCTPCHGVGWISALGYPGTRLCMVCKGSGFAPDGSDKYTGTPCPRGACKGGHSASKNCTHPDQCACTPCTQQKKVKINKTYAKRCTSCVGLGWVEDTGSCAADGMQTKTCKVCHGTGVKYEEADTSKITPRPDHLFDCGCSCHYGALIKTTACKHCDEIKTKINKDCPTCHGRWGINGEECNDVFHAF